MKVSFRITLLSTLLILLGTAVLIIGLASYFHARAAADDLAGQMLSQTAARIDLQFNGLLTQAPKLNRVNEARIHDGRVAPADFAGEIAFFRDGLALMDDLTGYFIGLEATGEATGITRVTGESIVWQSKRDPATGRYDVHEFKLGDYPKRPLTPSADNPGPDIRTRPWYANAKLAGRPIWMEASLFLGAGSVRNIPGVTYASPVYDNDGSLVAVLDADYDLRQLCSFLTTLNLGANGVGFVIETRGDGSERVIAYPDVEVMTRGQNAENPESLLAPRDFPDARVGALERQRVATRISTNTRSWVGTRFRANGEYYLAVFRLLGADFGPPWVACAVLSESEVLGRVHQGMRHTTIIGICVLLLGIASSLVVSRQVARPLEHLSRVARDVGELHFERHPPFHSFILEVDRLAVSMEDMKAGLRAFQKFVPADLVASFVGAGREASFTGERRLVTILFSDVADFTSISEELTPESLVERLREYFGVVSGEIIAAGGTVDKYIGDSVMAFWGAPAADPRHATRACQAALSCQAALGQLAQKWSAEGKTPFKTRIGVHTGEVVVGNIGSEARLNYTVIGDAVNLASRLEGMNKHYGTGIIISDETYLQARQSVVARPIDYVSVKGKRTPTPIYELLGLRDRDYEALDRLAADFGQALQSYRNRNWADAIARLDTILERLPDDRPSQILRERSKAFLVNPPAPDWDGIFRPGTK
jgi:adenylate cyclase